MRFLPTLSLLCLFPIVLTACAPAEPTASPGDVETVVAATFAAMTESAPTSAPEATFTAIASLTPPNTPEPTTFFARTNAQNVNLRVGPGSLFKVSRVMAQNVSVQVLGRARGDEWLYVRNDEGIQGWVAALFVDFAHDGPPPPYVEPDNANLITGTVHTELGTPVSGIGFAFEQGKIAPTLRPTKKVVFTSTCLLTSPALGRCAMFQLTARATPWTPIATASAAHVGARFPPKWMLPYHPYPI